MQNSINKYKMVPSNSTPKRLEGENPRAPTLPADEKDPDISDFVEKCRENGLVLFENTGELLTVRSVIDWRDGACGAEYLETSCSESTVEK